ncbi:hypothetical protein Bmyc01_51290 [Bacillus mycoides]|nr:hypothetical protein Bmyc01_51290 [Bacillus mycoides]
MKIFGIKDGNRVVSHKLITLKDFVPDYLTIDKLMMRFFITAKRCIEGENKELLFGSKDTDRIKNTRSLRSSVFLLVHFLYKAFIMTLHKLTFKRLHCF